VLERLATIPAIASETRMLTLLPYQTKPSSQKTPPLRELTALLSVTNADCQDHPGGRVLSVETQFPKVRRIHRSTRFLGFRYATVCTTN
jgi:hypothetical protein